MWLTGGEGQWIGGSWSDPPPSAIPHHPLPSSEHLSFSCKFHTWLSLHPLFCSIHYLLRALNITWLLQLHTDERSGAKTRAGCSTGLQAFSNAPTEWRRLFLFTSSAIIVWRFWETTAISHISTGHHWGCKIKKHSLAAFFRRGTHRNNNNNKKQAEMIWNS